MELPSSLGWWRRRPTFSACCSSALGLLDSSDGGDGESAGICGALAGRILLPLVFSGAAALVGGPPVGDSAWRYVLCFFQEMELW